MRAWSPQALLLGSLLVLLPASAPGASLPPAGICDPGLVGNLESELAYQQRGDRCEGIYKLEVNSVDLRLLSLVETFEAFDPALEQDLRLLWHPPGDARDRIVKLRAETLDGRKYYRMDAQHPASASVYSWPCDLLAFHGYGKDDLGVLAWLQPTEAETQNDRVIYLPLRIGQRETTARNASYELAFVPRRALEEAFITILPVSAEDQPLGAPVWSSEALGYGYYPSASPVFVNLPALPADGFYRVEIQARFSDTSGGEGHYKFLLYHEASQ